MPEGHPPEPIHDHASRKRIATVDDRLGHVEASAASRKRDRFAFAEHGKKAAFDERALGLNVAAKKDIQVARLGLAHDVNRVVLVFAELLADHVGAGKDTGERIVVLGGNRVVLVVVAAGAGDGQTEQSPRNRVDTILPLVGHHVEAFAIVVLGPEPEETQRDVLVVTRIVEQVSGQLKLDEPVVRHVVVQRPNHPVAIAVRVGIELALVGADDVGLVLGETGDVEPQARPPFAIARRGDQAIDQGFIRVR